MQICGDRTCTARGCSSEALAEWEAEQQEAARRLVRAALGLPVEEPAAP